MAASMKFYYDFMSPPSRALYILFKTINVPFSGHQVALRKGAHMNPEYKKVNRFQKVPCIDDNGFKLSESVAIIRYLHDKGYIPEAWYPTEIFDRARTDEYLEWQHNNLRMGIGMYFQLKAVRPMLTGKASSPELINFTQKILENALNTVENIWLTDNQFLTGNKINIADLFGACDIEQARTAGYDALKDRPKLQAWMKAVKESTTPHYEEAHLFVDNFEKKVGSKL